MKIEYDIHLSAYSVSPKTIKEVEKLGFSRDEFTNNTRCETTEYHGTFRGAVILPSNEIWEETCKLLSNDSDFSGGLEEEAFGKSDIVFFDNKNNVALPYILPPMVTMQPPPNTYKACDIHINIDITNSDNSCLQYLDALSIPSFDKPKNGNVHRIYSITCESLKEGRQVFNFMKTYLKTLPNLQGKMKFEKTTRFFRLPTNAVALPIINSTQLTEWFSNVEILCNKLEKRYS